LLTSALSDVLSRSKDPSFSKVMRNLESQLSQSLKRSVEMVSSQAFDVTTKRFSLSGGDIMSNMNEVLGRSTQKAGRYMVLSEDDPLCPSARWRGAMSARPMKLQPLSDMPPFECYQNTEGIVYNGEWFDAPEGPRTGYGGAIDYNGQLYVGQWSNDLQEGTGEQVWPDGTRYEGAFSEGVKHGEGRIWWPDGAEYLGELKNDKLHGDGSYRWPDGCKFRGQWANNKMHGEGTYTWKQGPHVRYDGAYQYGKKEGEGTLVYRDGRPDERGRWRNGERVE
jgi:hypothetical protein